MPLKLTRLPELNQRVFAILSKEHGVPDTLRFFGQLGLGVGNYTEERRQLFADLTLDEYRQKLAGVREGASPQQQQQ